MPKIIKSFKTSERWKYQLKTSRANRLILKIILGKLLLYNTQFLILGFILKNHPHTLKTPRPAEVHLTAKRSWRTVLLNVGSRSGEGQELSLRTLNKARTAQMV